MPRPTAAQLAYGSITVIFSTLAMLLLSQTSSAVGTAVVAVSALALGLLVAMTVPQPKSRVVAVSRPAERQPGEARPGDGPQLQDRGLNTALTRPGEPGGHALSRDRRAGLRGRRLQYGPLNTASTRPARPTGTSSRRATHTCTATCRPVVATNGPGHSPEPASHAFRGANHGQDTHPRQPPRHPAARAHPGPSLSPAERPRRIGCRRQTAPRTGPRPPATPTRGLRGAHLPGPDRWSVQTLTRTPEATPPAPHQVRSAHVQQARATGARSHLASPTHGPPGARGPGSPCSVSWC
ncbi:hypothetical protein RKD19_005067 [Streptomyces canus]